ncbi:MAG: hypothetical protein SWN98_06220 [Pseudomonadota bacterium]|nr:hypothetical protein [Pseudomonadota bacterium]
MVTARMRHRLRRAPQNAILQMRRRAHIGVSGDPATRARRSGTVPESRDLKAVLAGEMPGPMKTAAAL